HRPATRRPLRRVLDRDYPAGPVLDPHPLRPRGPAGGQLGATPRLHQPGGHPQRGRKLRHHGRTARPTRQLAADRRRGEVRAGPATRRSPRRHGDAPRTRRADAVTDQEGLPVIRMALWLLGAVLLGGIVHLATVLLLPNMATQDAYARVSAFAPVNAVT